MIKFFRQIRKDLMEKNNTGKYLKYAIGEIVLVVVGILFALQINDWNENRKERKQELIILENILEDLKKDQIGLKYIIERRTSKIKSSEIMASYYDGIAITNLADYYYHWTNVLYWEAHYPRNVAFKELVNSGNVSIIKNAEIRSSLLDINASYEELFAVREHLYDDYTIYLYQPYANIFDYGDGIEVWSNPDFKIELSEEDVAVALKTKAIKNGFKLAMFNHIILKEQLDAILETVQSTIVLTEKELGR